MRIYFDQDRADAASLLASHILCIQDVASKEAADALLREMKSTLQEIVAANQEVSAVLQAVFGPAAVKVGSVQNLRQDQKICKEFSALLPQKNRGGRPRLNKALDDFVVVTPPEKVFQTGSLFHCTSVTYL